MDASKTASSDIGKDVQGKALDAKLDKDADPSRASSYMNDSNNQSQLKAEKNNEHLCKGDLIIVFKLIFSIKQMEAIKAGVESVKEAVSSKKAGDKVEKANDPTVKPSERVDAAFESGKAAVKAQEHGCKAELHKEKHASH